MYNIRWGVLLQRIGVQQLSKIKLCAATAKFLCRTIANIRCWIYQARLGAVTSSVERFWLAIKTSHGQRFDRTISYASSFLRMYHDSHLKRARLAAYFFQYRSHDFCQN